MENSKDKQSVKRRGRTGDHLANDQERGSEDEEELHRLQRRRQELQVHGSSSPGERVQPPDTLGHGEGTQMVPEVNGGQHVLQLWTRQLHEDSS